MNESITVADLSDENFKIFHPETQVVCQVKMSRASMSIEENIEDEEMEEGETGESTETSGEGKSAEASDKSSEAKSDDKKDESKESN